MPTYKITSDTLTAGPVTKKITAANYPDALSIMDELVDELDGVFKRVDVDNPPITLGFDELMRGSKWGEFHNYHDNRVTMRWHIILKTGWIYSGDFGCNIGRRCSLMERLDSIFLHEES